MKEIHNEQLTDYRQVLANIAAQVGSGVRELGFRIACDNKREWTASDFSWTVTPSVKRIELIGRNDKLLVHWTFENVQHGCWVMLTAESNTPLHCAALDSLILTYAPEADTLEDWWVANYGATTHSVGLHRVRELDERTRADTMLRSVFRDSRTPGLLLGTCIPQAHLHDYSVAHEGDLLTVTARTHFTQAAAAQNTLRSEATWVCASLPVGAAMKAYAAHVPPLEHTEAIVGWNSWDYYFFAVSLPALIENMDALRRDPLLAQHIRYIVIDGGWEHRNGEWEPNYRFPGGLERAAAEITARGFIPGIWTAPALVDQFSSAGLTQPELLIKNQYGDPQFADTHGHYLLDPTHPAGEAFIEQLYTRLYNAGFRLFKVDYVEELVSLHRFHRANFGSYDALRHLFTLIRRCVTDESHIIGCSLPAACGAGYADSGRIGIDIHNHWSHVEWVCDYLQLSYWQHGRIWTNDVDFLVVRGQDTSRESSTNVTNPHAYDPHPPRWRRGPDFTLIEAQTWASIVALSGGNVFLSDHIAQLNDAGQQLIKKVIAPTHVAAEPLDLCDERRASLWLQKLPYQHRLTVINWRDEPAERVIVFDEWFDHLPQCVTDFWNECDVPVHDGKLTIRLEPHASVVLEWERA